MMSLRKYLNGSRERVTRLALETRGDSEWSKGAIAWIVGELGVRPEALRSWVKHSEIDGGLRAGTMSADVQWIRELKEENRELWRASEILRRASAYFV